MDASDDWRTDTQALTIQGRSGGGKTTTVRSLHRTYPGASIVFDLDEEPELGVEVYSVDELREALASGEKEIVIRSPEHVVEDPDLFPETVRFLMQLGNDLRERGGARMQFVMGECQDLQSKYVQLAVKRLRKRRIKPVVETQDPFSLSTRIRTQARYQGWISPPTSKQEESMQGTGWPVPVLKRLPDHDMIILGEDWKPIARYRATETYAVE